MGEFLITEAVAFAVDFAKNLMAIGISDPSVFEQAHAISAGVNDLHPDQPGAWRLAEVTASVKVLLVKLGADIEHAFFNAVLDTLSQVVHQRVISAVPSDSVRTLGSTP